MVMVKNLTKYIMIPTTLYKIAIKIKLTVAISSQASQANGGDGRQIERAKAISSEC